MARYWPSLLPLHTRRRRRPFRPRKWSANDRVQDWRLEVVERELDKLYRSRTEWISSLLQGNVDRWRLEDMAERYRLHDARIALNAEEIAGLKSREVAGWTAKEKRMAYDLVNQVAEEAWQQRQQLRLAFAILRKLLRAGGPRRNV